MNPKKTSLSTLNSNLNKNDAMYAKLMQIISATSKRAMREYLPMNDAFLSSCIFSSESSYTFWWFANFVGPGK
jgi:hypothetical protein